MGHPIPLPQLGPARAFLGAFPIGGPPQGVLERLPSKVEPNRFDPGWDFVKLLLKIALSLLGLAVAGIVGVFMFLDTIVGKGIEVGCTQALGVKTSVGLVRIGLLTGNFSIGSLRIDNPPGFETGHFFSFDRLHFEVPPDSFKQDTIVIPLLEIDGIDISLETVDGKKNYDVILANLKRFSSSGSADPDGEPPDAEDEDSGKELVIREAVIRDITARIDLGVVGGKADRIEVEIPEIRLHPNKKTGAAEVSVAQLTEIIVTAVLTAVAKKAPANLAKGLFKGLGGLETVKLEIPGVSTGANSVGDVVEKLGEGAGGAAKLLGEGAGRAIKGLGGLFGGGDEEE